MQVYEIAKAKQAGDAHLQHLPLESLCRSVVGSALSIGLEVVPDDLDGPAAAAEPAVA